MLVRNKLMKTLQSVFRSYGGLWAVAVVYLIAAKAVSQVATAADAMAQDSLSHHDKLALWVGHWKVRIDTKETQFGHAATEYFDSKCSFLPHGTFVACEYLNISHDPIAGRPINDV